VHHQAQYYSEKKIYVDQMLEEAEITYYKQQFLEPNWGIDADAFKNIHRAIGKLVVSFKSPEPYRDMADFKERVRESLHNKSTKKSKKDLKLPDNDKMERPSSKARYSNPNSVSPFMATFTPKNTSN
jgi:hypothetical protein